MKLSFLIGSFALAWSVNAETTTCVAKNDKDFPEPRRALVIGNGAYETRLLQGLDQLPKAPREARAVSATLCRLGFQVTTAINVTAAELKQLLDNFGQPRSRGEVRLFYYAGHAVQVESTSFLIPSRTLLAWRDIATKSVSMNDVFEALSDKNDRNAGPKIVLLDACRTPPAGSGRVRGLALPSGDLTLGSFVGFATAPGNVAQDGTGDLSPYTTSLLKHIGKAGLTIGDLFNTIRKEVSDLTAGTQVPWENVSTTAPFHFNPPPKIDRLEWNVSDADDLVVVLVNGYPVVSSTGGSADWALTPSDILKPGRNTIEIKVYNAKTYEGQRAVDPIQSILKGQVIEGKKEGWRYSVARRINGVTVQCGAGESLRCSGARDIANDSEWGTYFTVSQGTFSFDPETGKIVIP